MFGFTCSAQLINVLGLGYKAMHVIDAAADDQSSWIPCWIKPWIIWINLIHLNWGTIKHTGSNMNLNEHKL